jgi:myo-inositol-hexaphosphate 3-phosphohydrolase
LQEYRAWENSLTTAEGTETAFDDENYLFFYNVGDQALFKSSIDENIANANQIQWDYTGAYSVEDIVGGGTKRLTLYYAFYGTDYFELSVIDDETIRLYHPGSEKTYVYSGRNYIAFMRTIQSGKQEVENQKLRPQKTKRQENKRSQNRASELLYFINS